MPSAAVRDEGALQMRPAPRGYSSARLHDLKFTFTPAGADDSVHSKAPLPRGGCLRSAQTGRVFEPILFFPFQKEKNGFNLPRKERGPVHPVVLNLTQKISAISRPLRSSLPPERSLRSAHHLSAELHSKTDVCGRTESSAPTNRIRKMMPDRHHQDSVRRVVAYGKVTWGGQI